MSILFVRNSGLLLALVAVMLLPPVDVVGQDEFRARNDAFQLPGRKSLEPQATDGEGTSTTAIRQDDASQDRFGVMGEVTEKYVKLHYCFAELIDDVELPAEETGPLDEINVVEGQLVTADTVVAQIDRERTQMMLEEAQFKFDQASQKATDTTAVNAAAKRLELHEEEHARTQRLWKSGSESLHNYRRSTVQVEIARYDLQAAKNEKQLAFVESQTHAVAVKAAKASLARHELRPPFDGNVIEVLKDAGEWVQAGEPVMRIVRMDKLKISGQVDATMFNPPQIDGCEVVAEVKLAGGETVEFRGQVSLVSLETHADKFEIEVEIENRCYPGSDHWILRVGTQMDIRVYYRK